MKFDGILICYRYLSCKDIYGTLVYSTLLQQWICIRLVPGSGSIFGLRIRIRINIWNTDPDPYSEYGAGSAFTKRLDPDSYKVNADRKHCLFWLSLLEWKKIFKESACNIQYVTLHHN
jgi:hypothetical protein